MKPYLLFVSFFLLLALGLHAQQPDTTTIEILQADKLGFQRTGPDTEVQTLVGNVRIRQGSALFYCDSCVINRGSNLFEAFGKVHINDSDTAHVYSDKLRYHTDTKKAFLTGNVRLTDGHSTLTTTALDYDLASSIGIYRNGGRVLNKTTVLTSREGIYYADLKDFYFKGNVELKDPAYNLKSDSLLYNTAFQTARFIAETFIRDSTGRTIRTNEGYYDVANRNAEFTSRTTIQDGSLTVTGDRILNDDAQNVVQIDGRGVLIDTAEGINILADRIFANNKTKAFLATQKPLMIVKQDEDSIYVAADTLFSARLTDLYRNADSAQRPQFAREDDSTNRYFEAFRNVRIFSDSVQAVSDSMFYSFRDSTFQLYQDPVVWNNRNQIMGDTIFLYTRNKKADRVRVVENSFMISEVEPGVYNQIKSSRMDGYFKEGVIDSVRARGLAESIYFIQDDDSAYTSANQTASDVIDIYFEQGDLYKVVLRSGVTGTLWPITQKHPSALRLPSFRWLDNRRPKTKYDLFE